MTRLRKEQQKLQRLKNRQLLVGIGCLECKVRASQVERNGILLRIHREGHTFLRELAIAVKKQELVVRIERLAIKGWHIDMATATLVVIKHDDMDDQRVSGKDCLKRALKRAESGKGILRGHTCNHCGRRAMNKVSDGHYYCDACTKTNM